MAPKECALCKRPAASPSPKVWNRASSIVCRVPRLNMVMRAAWFLSMRCPEFCKHCAPASAHVITQTRQISYPAEIRIQGTRKKERAMQDFEPLSRGDQPKIRFLVVDDSVFARKSLSRMVEAFGGEVAGEAADGCSAITEYDRLRPDLVLMDITMPKMEGIEAVERIV